MAKLRLYPSGFTTFQPSPGNSSNFGNRRASAGWTAATTRALVRFLYSVDFAAITGELHSFTLTVRHCPHAPDDWIRVRKAFFRRLAHRGSQTLLWLTEWQRRGVPHLHGIVVLPSSFPPVDFLLQWLGAAKEFEPNQRAQVLRHIYDPVGWSEYLGKHSARGVQNYQRSNANIPPGWCGKTGRMWGHRGQFPTREPIDLDLAPAQFFMLRRILRLRAISQARARADPAGITYARTMLKHSDPTVSRVRGLSQFADIDRTLNLVAFLATTGRIKN